MSSKPSAVFRLQCATNEYTDNNSSCLMTQFKDRVQHSVLRAAESETAPESDSRTNQLDEWYMYPRPTKTARDTKKRHKIARGISNADSKCGRLGASESPPKKRPAKRSYKAQTPQKLNARDQDSNIQTKTRLRDCGNIEGKKSRTKRNVLLRIKADQENVCVLRDWCLVWPPSRQSCAETGKKHLNIRIDGMVLKQRCQYMILRRISTHKVLAAQDTSAQSVQCIVHLMGCLNIEKAKFRGVPTVIVELLIEGFPAQWKRHFSFFLKEKEQAESADHRAMRGAHGLHVGKADSECTDEVVDHSQKRSRSGRILAPVMEWWRGERLTTNHHGETVVDVGSPSYLTASKKNAKRIRMNIECTHAIDFSKTSVRKEPDAENSQQWSKAQLNALETAKMQVLPNAHNYWTKVAAFVPNKSADECCAKSFALFPSPNRSKALFIPHKSVKLEENCAIPQKMHRAGSNLWKKQVRQYVRKCETQNVDDVFVQTPLKNAIDSAATELGDADSLDFTTPQDPTPSEEQPRKSNRPKEGCHVEKTLLFEACDDTLLIDIGREVLDNLETLNRDDVDSYVLAIKKKPDASKCRPKAKAAKKCANKYAVGGYKAMRNPVLLTQTCGDRIIKGTLSPGGTAEIKVDYGSSTEEPEEEDEDVDENSDY